MVSGNLYLSSNYLTCIVQIVVKLLKPMGNFVMEKSKSGAKKASKEASAFSNSSNGSLDYMSKQSKFASKDASKIKSGAIKDSRYK